MASLDLRLAQFGAFTFGPGTPSTSYALAINAVAGGTVTPSDGAATLASFSTASGADLDLGTVAIGNPFPASYNVNLEVFASDVFSFTAPGATTAAMLGAGIDCTGRLASYGSGPIVPLVGPPAYPQINGASAFTVAAPVTTTPTLSWRAPVGTASFYSVLVWHVVKNGTATAASVVASLSTASTSLTLPSGILMPGQKYVFQFRARYAPNGDLTRPFRASVPDCIGNALSTLVAP
jgi:hypothetical protein